MHGLIRGRDAWPPPRDDTFCMPWVASSAHHSASRSGQGLSTRSPCTAAVWQRAPMARSFRSASIIRRAKCVRCIHCPPGLLAAVAARSKVAANATTRFVRVRSTERSVPGPHQSQTRVLTLRPPAHEAGYNRDAHELARSHIPRAVRWRCRTPAPDGTRAPTGVRGAPGCRGLHIGACRDRRRVNGMELALADRATLVSARDRTIHAAALSQLATAHSLPTGLDGRPLAGMGPLTIRRSFRVA